MLADVYVQNMHMLSLNGSTQLPETHLELSFKGPFSYLSCKISYGIMNRIIDTKAFVAIIHKACQLIFHKIENNVKANTVEKNKHVCFGALRLQQYICICKAMQKTCKQLRRVLCIC